MPISPRQRLASVKPRSLQQVPEVEEVGRTRQECGRRPTLIPANPAQSPRYRKRVSSAIGVAQARHTSSGKKSRPGRLSLCPVANLGWRPARPRQIPLWDSAGSIRARSRDPGKPPHPSPPGTAPARVTFSLASRHVDRVTSAGCLGIGRAPLGGLPQSYQSSQTAKVFRPSP